MTFEKIQRVIEESQAKNETKDKEDINMLKKLIAMRVKKRLEGHAHLRKLSNLS